METVRIDLDLDVIDFQGKNHYTPIIAQKKCSKYFDSEHMAIIYAGLLESGLSRNDCDYMSNYIEAMVKGTIKEQK